MIKILSNVVENNDSVQFLGLDWENNDVEIKRKVSFIYDYPNFYTKVKPNKIAKGIWALEDNFDYQYFCEKMNAHHLDWNKRISKYSHEDLIIFKIIIALSRQPEILIIDEPLIVWILSLEKRFLNC